MRERRSYKGLMLLTAVMMAMMIVPRLFAPKERINWRTNLSAATSEAQAANKPLFLYFTANWCGPCEGLKHTLWADASVDKAMQNFVPVKIDVDEHPDIVQRYPSQGIPHFVVASSDGKLLRESEGTMESEAFIRWIERGIIE